MRKNGYAQALDKVIAQAVTHHNAAKAIGQLRGFARQQYWLHPNYEYLEAVLEKAQIAEFRMAEAALNDILNGVVASEEEDNA